MRPFIIISSFILLSSISIEAQNSYLNGFWKGYITTGIVDGVKVGMTFELYLKVDKTKVTGRSYSYRDDGEIIEMAVEGRIHRDRSVSLEDASFLPLENSGVTPSHNKKYQFFHHRSIFQSHNKLDGYWQEITETPFAMKRRRGKITLEKVSNKTNKA